MLLLLQESSIIFLLFLNQHGQFQVLQQIQGVVALGAICPQRYLYTCSFQFQIWHNPRNQLQIAYGIVAYMHIMVPKNCNIFI